MRRVPPLPAATRGLLPAATVLLSLLPLLALARSADASGGIEVRRHGTSWARIEDDGTVRIEGRLVGSIEGNGAIRVNGRLEGSLEDDGTIREKGRLVGKVEKDGTIRSEGALLGRIEENGTIRKHGGLWGNASPCCPSFRDVGRVAALLFFFDRGFFGP